MVMTSERRKVALGQNQYLRIVYEDENILIVEKPPNILTNYVEGKIRPTMAGLVNKYLSSTGSQFTVIAHNNLNFMTGGLLVFAKNEKAFAAMNLIFKNRELSTFYRCVVKGVPRPAQAELLNYHMMGPTNRAEIYSSEVPGSTPVSLKYKVLNIGKKKSLLDLELTSVKAHQIRAQLAYIGHPIVGDNRYGDVEFNNRQSISFQQLQAFKLVFNGGYGVLDYLKGQTFKMDISSKIKL